MFLLIGVNPVKKVKDRTMRFHCPKCNDIRTFQEVQYRQFLSLFFIPVLPISKPASVFSCVTCGYSVSSELAAQSSNAISPSSTNNASDRVLIVCPRCDGPMFIPVREHRQTVICPHCTMEFIMKGIKGQIPLAAVSDNRPLEI